MRGGFLRRVFDCVAASERVSVCIAVYFKAFRVGDERDTLIETNKELKNVRKPTHSTQCTTEYAYEACGRQIKESAAVVDGRRHWF